MQPNANAMDEQIFGEMNDASPDASPRDTSLSPGGRSFRAKPSSAPGSAPATNTHASIQNSLNLLERSHRSMRRGSTSNMTPQLRSAATPQQLSVGAGDPAASSKSPGETSLNSGGEVDDDGDEYSSPGSCSAMLDPPAFAEALQHDAFFVLSGQNTVRILIFNLTKHKIFEGIVIFLIMANCVVLALERPLEPEPAYQFPVEIFFTVAFTVEMLLKWFALGVFAHPGAYIRNPWNVLDFVIVVFSYLSFHPSVGNLTAFRTLRVMRPLRSMNAVRGLQVLVTGLLMSMKGLVHVGVLTFFSVLICSILGVQLFGGKFRNQCADSVTGIIEEEYWCSASSTDEAGYWGFACPAGFDCREGPNPYYGRFHFDNVWWGMLTCLSIVTFDDWTKLLDASIATVGALSFWYYFFAVIMEAYFIPNLVLAVINDEFVKASEEADQKDRDRLALEQRVKQQAELKRLAIGPGAHDDGSAGLEEEMELDPVHAHNPEYRMTPDELAAWRATTRYQLWWRWERIRDFVHDMTEGYPRIDSPFLEELLELERLEQVRVRLEKVAERKTRIERARGETGSDDNQHSPSPGGAARSGARSTMGSPRTARSGGAGGVTAAPAASDAEKGGLTGLADVVSDGGRSRATRRTGDGANQLSAQEQAEKEILEEEEEELDEPPTTTFAKIIVAFILLNTAVLASQHYGQPDWLDNAQTMANRVLTAVFAVEFILRLVALNPFNYVQDAFNVLDGLVVIFSIVELALSGSSTVSVFRALRLLRILKLLRSFPSLRQIIQVTLIAIKDTGYLLLIIALYLFIVALVGMQFFAGAIEDTRMIFDDFPQAFYTVFQILTFDGWMPLMYESMENTGNAAVAYYVGQIIIGNYVLLSLFLSILLSSFDSLEQSTGDLENENCITYTLFDMSVAQSIFGRGAASKEELAEAAWVEPRQYISLNPHMQREYFRACHFFNKAVATVAAPTIGVSEAEAQDAEGGYYASEPSGLGPAAAATTKASDAYAAEHVPSPGTNSHLGANSLHDNTAPANIPSPLTINVQAAEQPGRRVNLATPSSPGGLSPSGQHEQVGSSGLTTPNAQASPSPTGLPPRAPVGGRDERRRSSSHRQQRSLFEIDSSRTLTGQKKKKHPKSDVTSDDGTAVSDSTTVRKRELLGLAPIKKKKKKARFNNDEAQEPGVTVLASAPPTEEKKRKENPEDIFCPLCRQEMPVPLPSAPLVNPPTRKELHKVQCKFISVRLAKQHVLDALTDIVHMYVEEGTAPKMRHVDPVIGQAWQVGLLLSETSESFVGFRDGWQRLLVELDEERDILDLHVGEEQLGRSLIAYALGNVPTEHTTNGGNALFIFGPRNPARLFCSQLVQNPWFDRVVLLLIILNTVSMALDNPLDDPESTKVVTLFWIGVFFAACFTVEMLLKWVAFGFVMHDGAYLRDSWNVLDCFIVFVSILGYALADLNVGFLRVFRTLRALRPLRVINRNRGLKMVVRTLLESVKGIVNVGLICCINYLIFGILAVQFFGGRFQSCSDPDVNVRVECNGTFFSDVHNRTMERLWRTEDRHFDDIVSSMLTLFEVSSGEWWGPVLYRAIDACSEDIGPQANCNLPAGVFFIVFFSVTGFFLINLFVGVVIHNFKLVKEQMDGSSFMTAEQKLWVSTQQLMLNFRPAVAMKPRKGSAAAEFLFQRLLSRTIFDVIIGVAILANIVVIAMDHHGMSDEFEYALSMVNLVFVVIFLVEAGLKLYCFGMRYFRSGWNQFDFFLVVLSVVGVVFLFSGNGIGVDLNVLRVFRIFRILRVIRLVRQAKKIRILLETLWYSLPSMGNIGAFVLLVDFIYGVLGVDLFAKLYIPDDAEILNTQLANFRRLDNALMMLFRFQTVEEWDGAMRDAMISEPNCEGDGCGSPFAPLYFVSHLVITAFVITNLLIAIILDNFETTMKLDNSALRMSDLNRFVEIWSEFDDDANMTVATTEFAQLLAQLQPPLGLTRVQSRKELLVQTAKYRIPEHGGYIHFIETLIPLARTVKLEEEGEGQLQLTDFEVREHEAMWRLSFPHLAELPTLRYREHTVTVDQYYSSTYIGAAYRSRVAQRRADVMRFAKVEKLMHHCDAHGIPYADVPYLRKFMDFYAQIRRQQALDERADAAKQAETALAADDVSNGATTPPRAESPSASMVAAEKAKSAAAAAAAAAGVPEKREPTEDEIFAAGYVGADKHYAFMSKRGQLPAGLKTAARRQWAADHPGVSPTSRGEPPHFGGHFEDEDPLAASRHELSFGAGRSPTNRGTSPDQPGDAARRKSNGSSPGDGASGSQRAQPRRYYSAIEAQALAEEERRRRRIPLHRAPNRKRLSDAGDEELRSPVPAGDAQQNPMAGPSHAS